MKKLFLYLGRWQLSSFILAPCMYLLPYAFEKLKGLQDSGNPLAVNFDENPLDYVKAYESLKQRMALMRIDNKVLNTALDMAIEKIESLIYDEFCDEPCRCFISLHKKWEKCDNATGFEPKDWGKCSACIKGYFVEKAWKGENNETQG